MPTYSVSPQIRKDHINKEGESSIFLRVSIDSKQFKVYTGIKISPKYWDQSKKRVRKTHAKHNDLNIEIRQRVAEANAVFEEYRRQAGKVLTKEVFLQEYQNPLSRRDFIAYMEMKIEYRQEKGEISPATAGKHRTYLRYLKNFRSSLEFINIDRLLLENFDLFYLKQLRADKGKALVSDGIGPRTNAIKTIKKYLRAAKADGIRTEVPDYSLTQVFEEAPYLFRSEIRELALAYTRAIMGQHPEHWAGVLRACLIMCFSGCSYKDAIDLRWEENIKGDMETLEYIRNKQKRFRKTVSVPITPVLAKYLGEKQKSGYILPRLSDQHINRELKVIAKKLGINKDLSTKVFRDTFATVFAEATGGDIFTLMRLMGHTKIETTAKYVHLSKTHTRDQVFKAFQDFED